MDRRPTDIRPRVGPFEVREQLGQGAAGLVYAARHGGSGRLAAVKLLRAPDPASRQAFVQELRAVCAVDHPHVIALFDRGELDEDEAAALGASAGDPWLAMAQADGTLRAEPVRGWAELHAVLEHALLGLAAAHAVGLVHRDLKPENLLRIERSWVLADFGIAWRIEEVPGHPRIQGTPAYMAPEQIRGRARDFGPWTDLYALGCLAWEQATGRPPFDDAAAEAILQAHLVRDPGRFEPRFAVPAGLEGWCRWMLAKDPSERPSFAADALAALDALGEPVVRAAAGATAGVTADSTISVEPGATWLADLEPLAMEEPGLSERSGAVRVKAGIPEGWTRFLADAAGPDDGARGLSVWGLREAPLVGRSALRERLWKGLRAAGEGPVVAWLHGVTGAGKSRMAGWLARAAHATGAARIARATASPELGALDGLSGLVARWFRSVGLSGEELRRRLVAQTGDPLVGAGLAAWMDGARVGDSPQVLALAVLREAVRDRPVVAWLDDVQWDPAAVALVEQGVAEGLPVLWLLTVRDDVDGPGAGALRELRRSVGPAWVDLPVEPLGGAQSEALIRAMLDVEDALVGRLATRTGGNPMFAVALLADWVERGLLAAGPRGLRLVDGTEPPLPTDLIAAARERVERVLAGLEVGSEAVEVAAVLGLELRVGEWERACAEAGVRGGPMLVERLLDAHLWTRAEGGVLRFTHGTLVEALVARAAERGVLPAIHRACAVALDGSGSGREGWHWLEAGEPRRAFPLLLSEAWVQVHRGSLARAKGLLDEAQRALDALPHDPARASRLEQYRVVVARHEALAPEMLAHAERALALARESGDRGEEARARVELGAAKADTGDIEEAEAHQLWAVAHAREPYVRMLAHRRRAELRMRMHRYDAEVHRELEEALAACGYAEGDQEWASTWTTLGALDCLGGDLDTGARRFRAALEVFERIGARADIARIHQNLGNVLHLAGHNTAALAALERARGLWGDVHHHHGVIDTLTSLGTVLGLLDRYEEGIAALEEAQRMQEVRALDDWVTHANLARLYRLAGRRRDARRAADLAVARGPAADAPVSAVLRAYRVAVAVDEPELVREDLAVLREIEPASVPYTGDVLEALDAALAEAEGLLREEILAVREAIGTS